MVLCACVCLCVHVSGKKLKQKACQDVKEDNESKNWMRAKNRKEMMMMKKKKKGGKISETEMERART